MRRCGKEGGAEARPRGPSRPPTWSLRQGSFRVSSRRRGVSMRSYRPTARPPSHLAPLPQAEETTRQRSGRARCAGRHRPGTALCLDPETAGQCDAAVRHAATGGGDERDAGTHDPSGAAGADAAALRTWSGGPGVFLHSAVAGGTTAGKRSDAAAQPLFRAATRPGADNLDGLAGAADQFGRMGAGAGTPGAWCGPRCGIVAVFVPEFGHEFPQNSGDHSPGW